MSQPKSQPKPQTKSQMQSQSKSQQNKSENRMGCLDGFALLTGSIGLIADTIALVGLLFLTLNISNNNIGVNEEQLPSFAVMIMFCLVLIYSWLSLAWYFCRRYFNNLGNHINSKGAEKIKAVWNRNITSIVAATGVATIPIWWLWIFFMFLVSSDYQTIDVLSTFTVIVLGGTILLGIIGFFLGLAIDGIITVLMPVMYIDMAAID